MDDVHLSNPPSNPELLDALARKAVKYGFDLKKLGRDICLSRTYQLFTRRNPLNPPGDLDERNFARQSIRRRRAEVLLDCINQVTETTSRWPGLPRGGKAVQIPVGRVQDYFLVTFGRPCRTMQL